MSKDTDLYAWFEVSQQYFTTDNWMPTTVLVQSNTIDFSSVDSQNRMHSLNTALQECRGCQEPWHVKHSLKSWYEDFANWVSIGSCSFVTFALIPGQKIVVPEAQFYPCLEEWFGTDFGRNYRKDIFMDEDGVIHGYRELVTPIKTANAYEVGRAYIRDIRRLVGMYGISETYSFSEDMLTMELFVVLIKETILSTASSVAAIFVVALLITGSRRLSLIVTLCVLLTDLFLLALMPLVDLNFNNVALVYLITSLGLSVLYTIQITHTYLIVEVPMELEPKKQRAVRT